MFCASCGSELISSSKFCSNCGAPAGSDNSANINHQKTVATPRAVQATISL